jgi:hypothetical protein
MESSARGGSKSMRSKLARIVALVATVGILALHAPISVADVTDTSDKSANTAGVTITSPTEGQSLINTNVEISGTAPAGVLVGVTITDSDVNQPLVEHQPFGKIQGSVTSDQDGRWVFTPQQEVVPSSFKVQAIYVTADDQEVSSRTIQFVATTSSGSAHVFSRSTIRGALVAAGGLFLFFLWLCIVLIRHHRRRRHEAAGDYTGSTSRQEQREPGRREIVQREQEQEQERVPEHGKPLFYGHFGRPAVQRATGCQDEGL